MAKPSALGAYVSATFAFLGFFVLALFVFVAGRLPDSLLGLMPIIFYGVGFVELVAVVLGFKNSHHRLGWLAAVFGTVIVMVIAVFAIQGRIV